MTVVISDLVARVRAEGVEQTAQQVKQVGDAAAQTARALQIMAESAAKAAPTQGNAAQILEMFQKANVQPTAAAMAQAAAEMQKATQATQQAVQPTQNLARAAAQHAEGWKLSETSIVRFGAALVGVNLGLNIATGAARLIHEELLAAVGAAHDLSEASRQISANYGPGASVSAQAAAFAADPTTRGSQVQYTQAVAGLRSLTTEYGLSLIQVQQLVTASGQLARIQGVELPTAATALGEVMRGNVNAASALGISITDQSGRIRGLNASYDELVSISGRSRAEQLLFQTTIGAVQTQLDNTRGSSDALADSFDRLGKNAQRLKQDLADVLGGPAGAVVNTLANALEPQHPSAEDVDFMRQSMPNAMEQQAQQSARIEGARAMETALQSERADLVQVTQATQQNTAAVVAQTNAYEQARIAIDHTVEALGRVRAEQSQFGTLGQAAQGPLFPLLVGSASTVGAAQAAQDELALRQQRIAAGSGDQMRRQLQDAVGVASGIGPNALARAQQDLASYDARVAIRTQQVQAQQRAAQIDLQTAQTQADLERIQIQQRERYIQLMRETLDLRILDNQQQQRGVEAQIALTRAQQAAFPSQRIASEAQYQQNLAAAIAQQRMARQLQGQSTEGLPSLDDLINQRYRGQLIEAENAPALVQGARGVELASQQATLASLDEQITQSNIHLAELANEGQNLRDIPAQLALQSQLLQYQSDSLGVQIEQRELLKALVYYLSNNYQAPLPGAGANHVADRDDRIVRQTISVITAPASPPAASELAGARR